MHYAILLRLDSTGARPVLVREGDELACEKGVRWRYVAEADDYGEAVRVTEVLQRRCEAGEL